MVANKSEVDSEETKSEQLGKLYVNPLDLDHLSVHKMDFYAIIHEYEGPKQTFKRKPFEVFHHPV